MIISVKQFGGVSPRTPPRYLQPSQAQVALNCPAWFGSLKGLPGLAKLRDTTRSSIKSLYRFGQDSTSEELYWFEFTNDTDVVPGPVAGDVEERTYWTDGSAPKKTNNVLALTGGVAYPIDAYDLGVPRPAAPCFASVSGTGTGTPETRVYTYTYVTGWGEESQPADASTEVDVAFGQAVSLVDLQPPAAGNHNIATKRIYRAVAGTGIVEYLFVAEIPAAQTTFSDTVAAEALGEVLPSMDWAVPPSGLKGLVALPNGLMAGFTGRDVYFCEPYRPFAWPADYINTVDYPVVALGVMDTTLAVLTTGVPYFLQGTEPAGMAMVKSDIKQACVSKRSVVSMNGGVYYASPDGLVQLSPAGSTLVTDQLFSRDQWQQINPATIRAYHWESKYVAFYDGGGFIYDPLSSTFVWHDLQADAGYCDLKHDTLYLARGAEMFRWYAGDALDYVWRSKKFMLPAPMPLSVGRVEAETYPITLKVFIDGVLHFTKEVTSRDAFKLPPGRALDVEFELTGDGEVFAVALAQSVQELAGA